MCFWLRVSFVSIWKNEYLKRWINERMIEPTNQETNEQPSERGYE